MQETGNTKIFNKLFCELEDCDEEEQKQKVKELHVIIDGMDRSEFLSILTEELFDKIHNMTDDKKLNFGNAIVLLKHIGYCNTLKRIFIQSFEKSSLNRRIEEIIINENKKKGGKDEKLLVDLCEGYLMLLIDDFPEELLSIGVPCLLKVALSKEESEETQKEVEKALLTLNSIRCDVKKELYLDAFKEIIQYHQKCGNLTHLAYQSAWQLLIERFYKEKSLGAVANELHFVREAIKELEWLIKNIDWKRKEERRGENEGKEEYILIEGLQCLEHFFLFCQPRTDESVEHVSSVTQIFRAATDNREDIGVKCLYLLIRSANNGALEVEDLLKGGAVDAVLEGLQRHTFKDKMTYKSLKAFLNVSNKLKEKGKDEVEEEKRKKIKMEMFEKMEEEGYEDCIESFHKKLYFLNSRFYFGISLNVSDYFANI
ncbi:uncharacterized protein MONOS_4965 [Monocercomonoides exilis]|uniref:uncharacterized protein n=1 Tax=Monocercomonoides exilis TaxID=2049356 RepID=UPI00355A34A5|nr:hypothetical protein MONOS_4965 [Monocercomonoides exilis]|eukprot:MONOS_4965.1-p1 / transcript=MONOS_4965.1 / gene=MONOS_4965 / organism=Monocercomonoides_exilis_PA203 / gene_product=unspecified product / transcript_product=unspecified product / location=Mono_scaffold00139:52860-54267(+) / protein_length=429 / sequence_SO=supercontig / SO=protein_coding / is_pseudo=false